MPAHPASTVHRAANPPPAPVSRSTNWPRALNDMLQVTSGDETVSLFPDAFSDSTVLSGATGLSLLAFAITCDKIVVIDHRQRALAEPAQTPPAAPFLAADSGPDRRGTAPHPAPARPRPGCRHHCHQRGQRKNSNPTQHKLRQELRPKPSGQRPATVAPASRRQPALSEAEGRGCSAQAKSVPRAGRTRRPSIKF